MKTMICDDANPQVKEIYDFLCKKLNLPQNVVGITLHMYPGEPIEVHVQYVPILPSTTSNKELKH